LDVDAHYLGFIRGNVYDPAYKAVTLEDYKEANAYLKHKWVTKNPYQNAQNLVNVLMTSVNEHILATDEYFIPCVAGEKMITIDEEGRVKPCEILQQIGVTPYIMGSLREHEYDVYKVLATDQARSIRERILRERCHCTFECANQSNVAFSLPSLGKAAGLHVIQRLKRES
jgi:radical SAM protein with 4Fe4S-binding SPASM domain